MTIVTVNCNQINLSIVICCQRRDDDDDDDDGDGDCDDDEQVVLGWTFRRFDDVTKVIFRMIDFIV